MAGETYNCCICGKEYVAINGVPIKDINNNWFCPSCYKTYGKPNLAEIKEILERIEKRLR